MDYVSNASGHHTSMADIEYFLVVHKAVARVAVIGHLRTLKGQRTRYFTELSAGHDEDIELIKTLRLAVITSV